MSTVKQEIEGFRLAPQQHRLWLLLEESPHAYCAQSATLIEGPLQRPVLEETLARIVSRHEILRTNFCSLPGMQLPLQVISAVGSILFTNKDLSAESPLQQKEQLARQLRHERDNDWRNQGGSVLRSCLVKLSNEKYVLALTLTALCADVSTVRNMLAEVWEQYTASTNGDEVDEEGSSADVVQYVQYSDWQHELLRSKTGAAENERSTDSRPSSPSLRLPLERFGLAQPALHVTSFNRGRELLEKVERLAAGAHCAVGPVLLSCWKVLLWRLTGSSEISLKVAFEGRKFAEMQDALGLYTKWLLVQSSLDERLPFSTFLSKTNKNLDRISSKQEHYSPIKSGNTFDIGFEYHEWPAPQHAEELKFSCFQIYSCTESLKLKLTCWHADDGLHFDFYYDPQLYDRVSINRLGHEYLTLLDSSCVTPELEIARLPLLPPREKRQLFEWNETKEGYPQNACIQHVFEEQVELTPNNIAVTDQTTALTYRELNEKANRLAHRLRSFGQGPESLVGICMDRSVEMIVGVLAVLKAGAAYVPLDPEDPDKRLSFILKRAAINTVVTQKKFRNKFPEHEKLHVICTDQESDERTSRNPIVPVNARNLAYIIFTSGSTGEPKAVMIEHRSVLNLFHALSKSVYSQHPGTLRVSLNAPLFFDASVKQLIQLLSGHTVCIIPNDVRRDPPALLSYLSLQQIDVFDCTPSQLRVLLAEKAAAMPKVVLLGGELIDDVLWDEISSHDQTTYYNVYGPTECTVDASVSRIKTAPDQNDEPNIGWPISNTRFYIMDDRQQLVPIGVAGDLYIGGDGLARGYLKSPNLTAANFIPDPYSGDADARLYRTGDRARFRLNGMVECIGRSDAQVKIRGYRIELAEIEAALAEHEDVREAAVVVSTNARNEKELVVYVVPRQHVVPQQVLSKPKPEQLTSILARHPHHILPNRVTIAHQNRNETEYLFDEIFVKRTYLQHDIKLPANACVFDVGANIGMFMLFVRQQCPSAKIYSFEPIADLYNTFRINAELYGGNLVKAFDFGLSNREKLETFTYYRRYTMMSGQSRYANAHDDMEVIKKYLRNEIERGVEGAEQLLKYAPQLLEGRFESTACEGRLRRLADVIHEEQVSRIDLLKIDVQRAELDVLNGIEASDWEKIGQVVMEVHDQSGTATQGRLNEIRSLLEEYGFVVTSEQDDLLKDTDRHMLYAVSQRNIRDSSSRQPVDGPAKIIPATITGELQQFLRERLPAHMIPASYVVLPALPLTRHGKVDRKALAAVSVVKEKHAVLQEPGSPVEELLSGLYGGVLQTERVGVEGHFFELGGHSLLATQLVSRMREVFGVEIGLRELFAHPRVGELARVVTERLQGGGETAAPRIVAGAGVGERPLSFAQQRLWFIDQLEGGSAFYNVAGAVRVEGPLVIAALEATVREVQRRHEMLRTHFAERADGTAVQVIEAAQIVSVAVAELQGLNASEQEREVERLVRAEGRRPFALGQGPLLRVRVLRLGASEHVVLLTMHHIVCDGWSLGVLVREVAGLYAAYRAGQASPLAELEIQYGDYAAWQREYLQGEVLERQLGYWRRQLGGELPVLRLASDYQRPVVQRYRGAVSVRRLGRAVTEAVKGLGQEQGTTLYMTLLAVFAVLLQRYTEQEELLVGTAVANRTRRETEALIGFFINTLVLRLDVSGDPPFTELLSRVREVCLDAYAHQEVPFEKLVEELQPERSLSQMPLFQVAFGVQNAPLGVLQLEELRWTPLLQPTESGRYDLTVWVTEGGGELSVRWTYNTDLFAAERIERLQNHYARLLESVTAQPNARLSVFQMLTDQELLERVTKRRDREDSNMKRLKAIRER